MTNSIEIKGLRKAYDHFALEEIDLTLPGGAIMGLIGENGAGKTTLIKCILNLIHRDAGEITLMGMDNIKQEKLAKQEIGVVLDECFFHESLHAGGVEQILGPVFNTWDHALFVHYLDKFSLPEKRIIKEYSRGMKMKLSLAAALAHRPRLLILDEATSGLDPVVRDEILEEFLAFISDEAHSILVSSHITSDLEKVADYITYIHKGRVALAGEKDTILEQYGRLVCTREQLDAVARENIVGVRHSQFGSEALVRDRRQLRRQHPSLAVEDVTLDEIMVFVGRGNEQ